MRASALAALSIQIWAILPLPQVCQAQGFPPAAVIVSEVLEQRVSEELELVGRVRPRRSSLVASQSDGIVFRGVREAGQSVTAGDVLFRLHNPRLRASLIEALADVELRRFEYDRDVDLLRQDAVSEHQLRSAEYELDRARSKLLDLQSRLDHLAIRAPFSGHVIETFTALGQWVNRGDSIAQIISTDTIRVVVNVPERFVSKLRSGELATVTIEALGGEPVEAHIVAIVAEGYPESHSFPVVVETLNAGGRIRSNMSATVSFAVASPEPQMLVHKDALIRDSRGSSVFVAVGDVAGARPVEVGVAHGSYVTVASELLSPGDLAIVRGNERLRDGQAIRIIRKLQ